MAKAEPLVEFRKTGQGPALIILHGVFGSGDNWLTVGKAFAEHFTLYAVDQRNHGRSFWSNTFTYPAMAADIARLMESEGQSKAHILGHSMGGKVAMQFAVDYPHLIDKLVVVDISPRAYKPHHQAILDGFYALDLPTLTSRAEAEQRFMPYVPELDTRSFLLKNLYRKEEGGFGLRINLDVIAREIEQVGASLSSELLVTLPSLFVRGQLSRYIQERDEVLIAQQFPNSSLITIADAGHWVQAEKPAAFIEAVLPFLLR